MKNRLGSIYANLLKQKHQPIDPETDFILHSPVHYKDNKIDLSLPVQKQLRILKEVADDPKSLDAIFLFKIGSEETLSPNFQQWTVSYNPAYSFMRPWVISTLSMTLMVDKPYIIEGNLNPGFCPFIPALKMSNIFDT